MFMRIKIILLPVFLTIFLLLSFSNISNAFELKILSYNIHGLPIPFFYDHTRYLDIGKELSKRIKNGTEPHIIAIQEGFNTRVSELIKEVNYPYVSYGPKAKGGKVSSGLIYLSKFPIQVSKGIAFRSCTGFDCMSRKGSHLIEVEIPDINVVVKVYNTHMNANDSPDGPDPAAEQARLDQIQDIRDFYWDNDDNFSPKIFVGDFNFSHKEYEYSSFEFFTSMRNSANWCLKTRSCAGEDPNIDFPIAIDHQFFASTSRVELTPVFYERNFREKVNGRYLSDHLGHEVHYKIKLK
jgi:exonuclease III